MKKKTKEKFERLLWPFALNVPPNWITFLSILFTLGSAYFVWEGSLKRASLFFLIGALLDALDGVIAKKFRRETRLGAFLDRTADRINDGIIVIAITYAGFIEPMGGILLLFLMLLASYMSAVIEAFSKTRIGEELSMRPIRTGLIFFGMVLGQLYYAMWILMVVVIFEILLRAFKAWEVLG